MPPGTRTASTTSRYGCPRWSQRQGGNVYTGKIYQSSGPRFDVYDKTKVVANPVGTATLIVRRREPCDVWIYVTVAPFPGPIIQSKPITRFPFSGGGATLCQ